MGPRFHIIDAFFILSSLLVYFLVLDSGLGCYYCLSWRGRVLIT